MHQLTVSDDIHIPFDISCGIDILDHSRIVIDKLGITEDKQILLCRSCHDQLSKEHQPSESVANFLWIGPVPKELLDRLNSTRNVSSLNGSARFDQFIFDTWAVVVSVNPDVLSVTVRERPHGSYDYLFEDWSRPYWSSDSARGPVYASTS